MKKIRVAVIFGGRSAEHEVSLQSARNIIASLDRKKYEVIPIGIDKKGRWHQLGDIRFLKSGQEYHHEIPSDLATLPPEKITNQKTIDVVFPVLHGPFGEDGTVQGLLKLSNLPFIGASVLGSAIGMDKDVQKRLLHDASIPTAKFNVINSIKQLSSNPIKKYPVFVKPANLGSSVGISKAKNQKELTKAIKEAFKYDRKVIIEEAIVGREIEISVLGNEKAIASVPGEVVPTKKHGFYSYDAKYLDENGAKLIIPADLPPSLIKKIQATAIKAYQVLCCEGMARVDMFLSPSNKVYINEINTVPGFTNISMYPKLWAASGLPQSKLIDKLIHLALSRFKKEQKLLTSH